MLLLGNAGSGKSIMLQLKFIEAISSWTPGKPLPIYFNLANNIDIDKIFDSINKELRTNIVPANIKEPHLYIDSFDEGLGIEEKRDTLVNEYI